MMMKNKRKPNEPEWAHRAKYIDHKPEWVGVENHIVPLPLWELGRVFFPLPNLKKGWNYPHHSQEYRYKPTDEKFNAYIESGSSYGIACAGDLIVIDIDCPGYVDIFMEQLPETVWQVTGSREGVHMFFKCPGLNTRQTLYHSWFEDYPHVGNTEEAPLYTHIGEIKADPHGYVVGPGSTHPSGNKYGPLQGEEIGEITEEDLMDVFDPYIKDQDYTIITPREYDVDVDAKSKYDFYNLTADDVVPWLEPENRVPHPGHGSDTGTNFMKNEDRETFTCWRHNAGRGEGCGLNAQQLLAQMYSGWECDDVRINWSDDYRLYWYSWRKAVDDGLVSYYEIPHKVAKGYAVENDMIDNDEELRGKAYWDVINMIRCEIEKERIDLEPLTE